MEESTIVEYLYPIINDNIFAVIFIFAAIEFYLVGAVYFMLNRQSARLADSTDNLLKGFSDAPDKDSGLHIHEKIESTLRFITNKLKNDPDSKLVIRQNAGKITERSSDNRYFGIEMHASIMSTLVQVFPLLGILGTVLAIAQTDLSSGVADPQEITTAFVMAMHTTILGIGFSILFMVIESALHPKIERSISDSKDYKEIINSVYLS